MKSLRLAFVSLCIRIAGSEAFAIDRPSSGSFAIIRASPKVYESPSSLGRSRLFKSGRKQSASCLVLRNRPTGKNEGAVERQSNQNSIEESCWNPKLRRVMGGIACVGASEMAYLVFNKLSNNNNLLLCGNTDTASTSGCGSVLDGPYSLIPGTDIPLSLLGFVAYATAAFLALAPMLSANLSEEDESINRLLLAAITTAMGVFSVFLMALLLGVLKETCVFCFASAVFSVALAKLAWIGGVVPSERMKQGILWSATGSGVASIAASVLIFSATTEVASGGPAAVGSQGNSPPSTLLASTATENPQTGKTPPPILSSSSPRALGISRNLQSLNARMFGAYWCSHCYDQKERLGKEAMGDIPYIECSREGSQSQFALCKQRDVPGYPTWEINGNLYPGEKELDELEQIIRDEGLRS